MKFLKYFKQIKLLIESLTDTKNIDDWKLLYNHGINHNLDDKLKERTNLNEKEFNKILYKVKEICNYEGLKGDWIFYSLKDEFKIVLNINNINKTIYLVTILSKKQATNTNNIKLI